MSTLRIATRKSPLALIQATLIQEALFKVAPNRSTDLLPLTTSGDLLNYQCLADFGGKGLFIKELEKALLEGNADLAVHSVKDLPPEMPSELILAATTRREDPRDVFLGNGEKLQDLSKGARIGTSSPRRTALLRYHFPHLIPVPLRGNVNTRLEKLKQGEVDGLILAAAGLKRLNQLALASQFLDTDFFIPSVGQGALGIQCLSTESSLIQLLEKINDPMTHQCILAERQLIRELGGNCHTPIGSYCREEGVKIQLTGAVIHPSGSHWIHCSQTGPSDQPQELGRVVAATLLQQGARELIHASQV